MLRDAPLVAFVAFTDAERAKMFYGQTLGPPLLAEDEFALVLDAHGTTLRLARVESLTPAPYTVLAWRVDDIRATVGALVARGVAFERFDGTPQDEHAICAFPGGALRARQAAAR